MMARIAASSRASARLTNPASPAPVEVACGPWPATVTWPVTLPMAMLPCSSLVDVRSLDATGPERFRKSAPKALSEFDLAHARYVDADDDSQRVSRRFLMYRNADIALN